MFKIHKDAITWSEALLTKESPIKTQMDIFYLLMMVGVGKGFCPEYEESQVKEVNRIYTDKIVPLKDLLAGVLLVSEINNYGLPIERRFIKGKVSELFDSNSQTSLSDRGILVMNRYAFGGFEEMKRKLPKAPAPHDFLIWFNDEVLSEIFKPVDWGG